MDANNKVLVAYGEFDYDTVEMFDANGKSLGTLACQLPDTGYMNVMSHFATAELSNLVISEGCEGPKSGPKVEVVPDPPVMTKEETDSTMKYVYDFNTTQNAVENYVDFMGLQMNNWKVADSKITCTDDNWADIAFTQAASFTGGYEMTMDFSVKTAPDSGNHQFLCPGHAPFPAP